MLKIYFKVPALSDTLLAIDQFEGNTISALKCAIKEAVMPALQTPICNLDLKIGNSIIGEEILGDSDLRDVLEEAQISILNPIIVIPSITYLDQCILCFCFSFGLGLGYFVALYLGLTNVMEEYHYPFIADIILFAIEIASIGSSLYIIWHLIRLSGKQQWNSQFASVFAGVVFSVFVELSFALLRKD
ncbi:hypothetical protein HDV02_006320 [Globomyces sp. JEL0801]|nr:hypothetical protein HDV02_006320 [Globomyces sp. JEL0801]